MVRTAPVYRSHRLHAINPTAAVSDDVSYLYTLVGWGASFRVSSEGSHKSDCSSVSACIVQKFSTTS